jgi:hypothetical protein
VVSRRPRGQVVSRRPRVVRWSGDGQGVRWSRDGAKGSGGTWGEGPCVSFCALGGYRWMGKSLQTGSAFAERTFGVSPVKTMKSFRNLLPLLPVAQTTDFRCPCALAPVCGGADHRLSVPVCPCPSMRWRRSPTFSGGEVSRFGLGSTRWQAGCPASSTYFWPRQACPTTWSSRSVGRAGPEAKARSLRNHFATEA